MVNLAGVVYSDFYKALGKASSIGISIGCVQVISNIDQSFLKLYEEDLRFFETHLDGFDKDYELVEIFSKGLTSWQ